MDKVKLQSIALIDRPHKVKADIFDATTIQSKLGYKRHAPSPVRLDSEESEEEKEEFHQMET